MTQIGLGATLVAGSKRERRSSKTDICEGTEEKPRCQRCVAGGFECQYGTRLSFLSKNSFTVTPTTLTEGSPSYRKVQFVDDKGANSGSETGSHKRQKQELDDERSPILLEAHTTSSPADTTASLPTSATEVTRRSETDRASSVTSRGTGHVHSPAPVDPFASRSASAVTSPWKVQSPTEDYEIALDVLLSLGNNALLNEGGNEGGHELPETPASEAAPPRAKARVEAEAGSIAEGGLPGTEPAKPYELSDERVIRLLRYYRYEIAPWVSPVET
ncbi:hypothetical protein GQ53DRAFT_758106 [Thozetella sp. PMI_491]|nr:hypothetical protein GQ53DRAFT_758106 [Thozetella sp. PMI_491]